MDYRATAGRPLGGVEARVVDDEGKVLPRDGHATGEIEVRGPWVAAAYYKDPAPEKFRDGWLRTGDVGRIDARGYITISDRAKDVVQFGRRMDLHPGAGIRHPHPPGGPRGRGHRRARRTVG